MESFSRGDSNASFFGVALLVKILLTQLCIVLCLFVVRQEWMFVLSCLDPAESDRVGRFMFKRDAKMAAIGQVLLLKAAVETLSVDTSEDVRFERTSKGKPVPVSAPSPS